MSNPLLEQLAPIAQPLAPGIWPLAYGWWILLGLGLLFTIVAIVKWLKVRRYWAIKRTALARVTNCKTTSEINALLKQVALHYFNQPNIAAKQGVEWAHFLAGPIEKEQEQIEQIMNNLYCASTEKDMQQFSQIATTWLNALSYKYIKEVNHA